MNFWNWWKAQWPSMPTHLCVASAAAGALIMVGLLCSTTLGWTAPGTLIGLVGGVILGLIAAAIEANCTDRMVHKEENQAAPETRNPHKKSPTW